MAPRAKFEGDYQQLRYRYIKEILQRNKQLRYCNLNFHKHFYQINFHIQTSWWEHILTVDEIINNKYCYVFIGYEMTQVYK